jgi:endoglucanase
MQGGNIALAGALTVAIAAGGAMLWVASPPVAAATEAGMGAGRRVALGGVNASGGEFKPTAIPGQPGRTHAYPTPAAIGRYATLGARVVRIPFRWERLQPELSGAFAPGELAPLDAAVRAGEGAGLLVVLDAHNYGRYRGRIVSAPDVKAGLADLWRRLAQRYNGRKVAFGLMNEPIGLDARDWRAVVDSTAAAIRATGARNLLLVPGVRWTGAHSWTAGGAGSNAAALHGFRDSNFAIEMHQYLDGNSSGTSFACPGGDDVGARRLSMATEWLRRERMRGFLGEFAAGRSPECQRALGAMLRFMDTNADVWLGWTYWTAGPWWPRRYEFSVEPRTGTWPAEATALREWFRSNGKTSAAQR